VTVPDLLAKFGAVKVGREYLAPCPIHQPGETDPNRFKLVISPSDHYLAVTFCRHCGIKGDREHNKEVTRRVCEAVGVDPRVLWDRRGGEETSREWSSVGVRPDRELPLPAPASTLHEVYSDLLDSLELTDRHTRWLTKRGLDADWAWGAGYRSTPDDPAPVAKRLWERWGFALATVPGFTDVYGDGLKLLLRQQAVLTPCRNSAGQILALKQRLLDGGKGRLRLLSSGPAGGPKAVMLTHVPLGVGSRQWECLLVTEGERKTDVVWSKSSLPFVCGAVGIPGTGLWSTALPVIESLLVPAGELVIAMDRDGKPQTLNAQRELVKWGRSRGYWVKIAEWTEGKGIDDCLVRGGEVRVREVEERETDILSSPPLTVPPPTQPQLLKDWEICGYIKERGRVARSELPLRHPTQEQLISRWIREGKLRIAEKTVKGQVLELVE